MTISELLVVLLKNKKKLDLADGIASVSAGLVRVYCVAFYRGLHLVVYLWVHSKVSRAQAGPLLDYLPFYCPLYTDDHVDIPCLPAVGQCVDMAPLVPRLGSVILLLPSRQPRAQPLLV